jgi:hypothetical protein
MSDDEIDNLFQNLKINEVVSKYKKVDEDINTLINIKFNSWNPWNEESQKVPYKSTTKGIGNGEDRVAFILKTKTLGQNNAYDMDLSIPGINSKGEVKELDSANSFKAGRNGRDLLRPIKNDIITFLILIKSLSIDKIKEKVEIISEMSPDEICESNIIILSEICELLYNLKKDIPTNTKVYTCYDILTGEKKEINSTKLYKLLKADNRSIDEIKKELGNDEYENEKLLEELNHCYINNPKMMMDNLNEIYSILFKEITLIFVDEDKGYYIGTTNTNIKFNRITMGTPRFKVIF